ncbi:hypothetical protein [Pantoea cypripedii]|uniref:Uncharacterized protein n=1 Tax=Pantoea cypripedii TaxID=55209 RepID=A0A1X1EL05_PANCY|nr:hypothetical protein [Pantoea cypripedii]MBP2200008.1 hypothetical protein [Pantoea cypripedii]ORM89620.1 hypothetical protein HA50_23720 [Pantoea cypripedii]
MTLPKFADIKIFFVGLLRKINWEAFSVIIALGIFLWGNHSASVDKEQNAIEEVQKIKIMLHSEVEYNLQAIETSGYEQSLVEGLEVCIPLPDNDSEAIERLDVVAGYLHDDIYKATLPKLQNLPPEYVDKLVRYYNAIGRFKDLSAVIKTNGGNQSKINLFKSEYSALMTQSATLEELLRAQDPS